MQLPSDKIKQNNIISMICWTHSDEFGNPSTNRRKLYIDEFNIEGHVNERIIFHPGSEKLKTRCVYEYLSSGQLIKESWFDWRTDNQLDFYIDIIYSKEGVLKAQIKYDSSKEQLCRWEYKCDPAGNPLEIFIINSYPGNSHSMEEYKYDQFGNKTEMSWSFPNGVVKKWNYTNLYDRSGKLIEKLKINSDGTLDIRKTYVYDDRGLIVEKLSYPDYLKDEYVRETYEYK